MKKRIKGFLNRFYYYRFAAYLFHKKAVLKDPIKEANRGFKPVFKRNINLENPSNLIEKIYWLQFYSDTNLWTKCADKYLVRDYVAQKGYKDNLPKLYGKWDNPNDIDFDKLPNSFVLKTNNGCGTVMVVRNKNELNYKKVKKILKQWISIPYGYSGAQFHYVKIKPCIMAEELLTDNNTISDTLVDYKIFCFNGEPEHIWVAFNRSSESVDMSLYDKKWNKIENHLVSGDFYIYNSIDISKPKSLDKMLEMAKKLSEGFPQIRIDFYDINGTPYLGEMTFTTGYSFFTNNYYEYLGDKIDLSIIKKHKHSFIKQ